MQSKGRNAMKNYRGKSKKVLTNTKASGIIRGTITKRKDDKIMASTKSNKKDEQKKARKISINRNHFKALAWAVFAVHQGFMSWLVLSNFSNYFAVAGAVASFGMFIIAIAMVGACFTKASK